jgi:hypothetical protein
MMTLTPDPTQLTCLREFKAELAGTNTNAKTSSLTDQSGFRIKKFKASSSVLELLAEKR